MHGPPFVIIYNFAILNLVETEIQDAVVDCVWSVIKTFRKSNEQYLFSTSKHRMNKLRK